MRVTHKNKERTHPLQIEQETVVRSYMYIIIIIFRNSREMSSYLRDDDINFLRQRDFFHLALEDGDYVAETIAGDNEFRLFGHGAGFHCIHYNLTHAK